MISRRLASVVLGIDVKDIEVVSTENISHIRIWKPNDAFHEYASYDKYHLAFLCKKWANLQGMRGYVIESSVSGTMGMAKVIWSEPAHTDFHGDTINVNRESDVFKAKDNDEPEAIFKACQWILENTRVTNREPRGIPLNLRLKCHK